MPRTAPRSLSAAVEPSEGRGRPRGTSARALELIALDLFTSNGFDETTVDEIAAAAGVSRRTFFRYYESKAAVLWHEFDHEVAALRAAFENVPSDVALMEAIRQAVTVVNHYGAEDIPELRARMTLIGTVPALQASATPHYDAWEQIIIDFAARRLGESPESLIPRAIGRATLASCRAAYEQWITSPDTVLADHIDRVLTALANGFATEA